MTFCLFVRFYSREEYENLFLKKWSETIQEKWRSEQILNWEEKDIDNLFELHSKYTYKTSQSEELGAMLGFLAEIATEKGKTNADLLFQ